MTASCVTLRGVSKSLGGRAVLSGVHLEVESGTILVVLGTSGAGKSTLLRLVAGLSDPDAGTIAIGDRTVADPVSRVPAERRGVGMVFQGLELFPHLTVAENAAFGLPRRPRGRAALATPRVRELLTMVGLAELLWDRRPSSLSGGERQRTAIARALAPRPGVLLYDEPLANLDPSRRAELRALIRRLSASRESTVIYVTHDPAEALELGHAIVVLDRGTIVDQGTPDSLMTSPRCLASARALGPVSALSVATPFARRFKGAAHAAKGALLLLRPEHVAPDEWGAAAVVTDAFRTGDRHAFEARLADGGETVQGLSPQALTPGAAVKIGIVGHPPVLLADALGSDA